MTQAESAENTAGPHRDLPWLAALLALLAVQWAPFLFTNRTFYFRDLSFFCAPLIAETAHQWGAGILPAWNPHLACGAPLAADPNAGAFFPDVVIVALLGAGLPAIKALLLLRLALVPLAAYVALRRLTLPPPAAWLGAALASLSGPLASSLSSFPTHLAGAIFFLPLAACGMRLATGGAKEIAVSAILLALTVFAGSLELILQGVIVFAVCGLALPMRRAAPRVAIALFGGALLAAPQWLPAAALYPRTPRGLGRFLATQPGFLSFPPARLLELLWPGLLGDPTSPAQGAYWGRGLTEGVTPYLLSIAVGLLPLAFVPAALRHPMGRRLAVVTAIFLFLSFGRHLPAGETLVRWPVFGALRYPEKWWMGATLALAALGAIGWQELRRSDFRHAGSATLAAIAALGLSLLLAAAAWLAPAGSVAAMRTSGLVEASFPRSHDDHVVATLSREAMTGALVALALLLLLVAARRPSQRGRAAALLAAVAVAERLWRVAGSVPAAPLEELTRPTPFVAAAREASKEGRFFYDREGTTLLDPLRPFTGTLFGLSYAGNTDVDQFSDARSRDFADTLHVLPFSDDRKPALLRLANVRVIDTQDSSASRRVDLDPISASESGHTIYRLGGARPARLFYEAVRADSAVAAIRFLRARGFPTETVAVIEGREGFRSEPAPHLLSDFAQPRPDAFRLRVETQRPALLQVAVTFDPNWRVFVDGRPESSFPIDAAFLGVMVPAGQHEVAGNYRDPLFAVGAFVALAALVLLSISMRRTGRSARSSSPMP